MSDGRARGRARFTTILLCALTPLVTPMSGAAQVNPGEAANRGVYGVNDRADRALLRPVAKGYTKAVPGFLRRAVHNVLLNLGTPLVAVNQLLQGKPNEAFSDSGRFLVNSTVGIAGIFDPATKLGIEEHTEDFGQTLAVWGVPSGPYMVVPFWGPSYLRHAFGMIVEFFASPLRLISPARDRYIAYGVTIIDRRARLIGPDEMIAGDDYLFVREAYQQRREYLILDGAVEEDPFMMDEAWQEEP
ncbi:MAG TPA: VacJ family lipoprotein [Pseudomonadales bacterium]